MNRRNFVAFLFSLPFVSYFVGKASSKEDYLENPDNLTVLEFVDNETAQLTPECLEKLKSNKRTLIRGTLKPLPAFSAYISFTAWIHRNDAVVANDGYIYWGQVPGVIGVRDANGVTFIPTSKSHKIKVGRPSYYFEDLT